MEENNMKITKKQRAYLEKLSLGFSIPDNLNELPDGDFDRLVDVVSGFLMGGFNADGTVADGERVRVGESIMDYIADYC